MGSVTHAMENFDRPSQQQKLYDWAYQNLMPFIRRRFGNKSRAGWSDEDIFQLVFIGFTTSQVRGELGNREELLKWLRAVAERRIIDRWRRENTKKRTEASLSDDEPEPSVDEHPGLAAMSDDEPAKRVTHHPLYKLNQSRKRAKRENRPIHPVQSSDDSQFVEDHARNLLSENASPDELAAMLDVVDTILDEFEAQGQDYEINTFRLLIQQFTDKQIAEQLNVDVKSATDYVERVRRRFKHLLPDKVTQPPAEETPK